MRRVLFALAAAVLVAGCSNRTDGALRIVVTVDPSLKADCFEVDLSKGAILAYEVVKRDPGVTTYTIGAKQGSMPAIVSVQAKAYLGSCDDAVNRKFNGSSAAVDHAFPTMGVEVVDLRLSPPDTTLDNDRDGYVDAQKSGPDCDDTDGTVHPGSTQACGLAKDTNCDGKFGCQDPDCQSEPSCQSPGTKLAFVPATQSFQRGSCSQDVTLEVHDAQGAVTPVALDTTITFTSSDPKVMVLSGACTSSPVTSVIIPYGQSSAKVKVRSTVAGAQTVTATATGLSNGTLTLDVKPVPTAALVFTSAAQVLKAGDCSQPVSVELRDAANAVTTAAADTALGISTTATSNFDFFAAGDATCATPLAAPATITVPAGQSGGSFRVRSTRAALPSSTFTLGVHDSAGSTPDTQVLTVTPNVPSKLVFTSPQQGLEQAKCSTSAVRVELQDAYGNTTAATAATVVSLSATPALTSPDYFTFFTYTGTTVACSQPVTSVPLAAGASSFTVAIKAQPVGTYVMTASSSPLTAGTQTAIIVAGPPNHIAFTTAPQTVTAGACSGPVTVQAQDSKNTPSGPTADVQVTVATTNGLVAYADSSCTTALTGGKFTIAAGTTTNTIFFKDTSSGASTINLTSSLGNASQTESVNAGPPALLVWGTPNAATIAAGACSVALPLLVQDTFGNATSFSGAQTLNLSSGPNGVSFSAAPGCGSPASTFPLNTGATSFNVYATHTAPGSYALTGVIGALSTTATASLTVTPAAASQLVFTTAPPGSAVAGTCASVTVERRDTFNNPVPVTANTNDTLANSGITGAGNGGPPQFFTSSASCAAGTPTATAVQMASGSATATFWVRGRTTGTATITATESATVKTTPGAQMIVTAAPASRLGLAVTPTTLTVGGCSTSASVSRFDPFDNLAPDAAAATVTVSATGTAASGLKFFTDPACTTGQTGTFTIAGGASSVSIGVSGVTTGTATVTAASSPLTSGTIALTLNPASPALSYRAPLPTSVAAGVCTQVDVDRKDGLGNAVPVGGNTNITITSSGVTGAAPGGVPQFFSSAANCSGLTSPQTTLTVSMASGTSSITFWVRGRTAGNATITASEGGSVPSAVGTLGIVPAAASRLRLTFAATSLTAGACASNAAVDRLDQFDNLAPDAAALPVTLTATGTASSGVKFFTDTGCTSGGTASGSATIAAGATGASFSLNGTLASPAGLAATITASGGTLTNGTANLTFTSGPVAKLAFSSAAGSVVSAVCSSAITVQSQDTYGNPANVSGAALSAALSSNASGPLTFASNASCGTAVTSASIAVGSNTATFYFKANVAETVTLTATTTSPASAPTQSWTVTPAAPSKLAFKGVAQPTTIAPLSCAATPMTVQVQDAQGNLTTFSGSRTFAFASSNAAVGLFFSTSNTCATLLVPAQNVYASPSEFTVYLEAAGAGATTVTVSDVTGSGTLSATTPALAVTSTGTAGTLAVTASATSIEPGFCQPVVVTRQGASAAPWTAGSTPVTLSLPGGTTELSLHTDSACTSATTTSVTGSIANGSSTVTFYAEGHSAAAGTTITATATDTNGTFTSGTLGLSPLPLVRRGTCAFGAGSTFTSGCTVTPAIPGNVISRTLLVFQAMGSGPTPSDGAVECHLTSAASVTVDCTRFGSATPLTIAWQTVSYGTDAANNGLTVTHKTLDAVTLNGAANYSDLSGVTVNLASSFLLFSSATSDTGANAADFPTGFLSDTTHVRFNAGGAGFPASTTISYQLVQMAGATVDRGQVTAAASLTGQSFNVSGLANFTPSRTAMLHSVRFATASDTTDECRKRYRGTVSANNALNFERNMNTGAGNCANVDPVELAWERVFFPSSVLVQNATVPLLSGLASATSAAFTTAVAPHRSVLLFSGQGPAGQSGGETSVLGSDLGWSTAMADFAGSGATRNTVTVTKGQSSANNGDDASFTVFVVQFSP